MECNRNKSEAISVYLWAPFPCLLLYVQRGEFCQTNPHRRFEGCRIRPSNESEKWILNYAVDIEGSANLFQFKFTYPMNLKIRPTRTRRFASWWRRWMAMARWRHRFCVYSGFSSLFYSSLFVNVVMNFLLNLLLNLNKRFFLFISCIKFFTTRIWSMAAFYFFLI